MMKLKLADGASALIIVAHPDDETIWMGGTILINQQVDWTIFSLCRASDSDRAPKFQRVCDRYGAEAIMADLDDDDRLSGGEAKEEAKKILFRKLKNRKFDYIFTHGAKGEYGHLRHLAASQAVTELIKEKKLLSQAVFYFNYKKAGPGKRPSMQAKKNSNVIVPLSAKIFNEKKWIQAKMHGYDPNGIDVGFCANPEAFIERKIKS